PAHDEAGPGIVPGEFDPLVRGWPTRPGGGARLHRPAFLCAHWSESTIGTQYGLVEEASQRAIRGEVITGRVLSGLDVQVYPHDCLRVGRTQRQVRQLVR